MVPPSTPQSSKRSFRGSPQSSSKKNLKQASVLSFFSKHKASSSTPIKNKKLSLFVENDDMTENESGFVTALEDTNNNSIIDPVDSAPIDSIENSKVGNDSKKTQPGVSLSKQGQQSQAQDEQSENKGLSNTLNKETTTTQADASSLEDSTARQNSAPLAEDPSEMHGKRTSKRNVTYAEDTDDEDEGDIVKTGKKKRKQLSSDEEEEYIPEGQIHSDDDEDEAELLAELDIVDAKKELKGEESSFMDDDDDDDILSLSAKKPKARVTPATSGSPIATPPLAHRKRSPPARAPSQMGKGKHSGFNKENEERYQWLVHERDAQGRAKDDPDYDSRTLFIPSSAWSKFTPFEKQYWEIKSRMWDCIVFFKKGKFFELYEKDALLGNHMFDLKIAGGGRANMQLAGIPEMSFDYWAMQFIQHGYKVAKVDQRESMLAKEMREGNKGIVKRELQHVLTSGTLTDSGMLQSDQATFCLAIKEEPGTYYDAENGSVEPSKAESKIFGVAFIDTATGEIELLEFEDDSECSKLDTLMSQVKPKEIIMEKNNLCNLAHKIVKFNAQPQAIFNYLKPVEEFYDFNKTFDELTSTETKYFADMEHWPAVLTQYFEKGKKIGFSAFGGLLSYLKWLKLDESMITMGNIKEYNPIRSQTSLVLDGVTLQNLEIFCNSFDNSDRGTLFKLINRAITPMGKRMLKKWVVHPLLQKKEIEMRLDSVDLLLTNVEIREVLEDKLSVLPDLERFLARVHSGALKIKDFNRVIEGFESIMDLVTRLKNFELTGSLLAFLNQVPETLSEKVEGWVSAFDRKKAVDEGVIIPEQGVEPEFDRSLQGIKELEEELDGHLREYKKQFKCSNIQFKDSGKEIYTIEVPMSATKQIPSDWIQMSANKSNKRYYSPEVAKLARSMAEAREMHKSLEESLKSRLYKKFDLHYQDVWMPALIAVARMDCIMSLARTSESLGFPCCRPSFVDEVDPVTGNKLNGFVNFKELRHPCFNMGTTSTRDFIPNDISLGRDSHQIGLLTGANAAGKSTVLRMTCIAVIMAQVGCYVPAEQATLSPIDKIMTRLGANDNIMQGKSTFFVELSETKKILDIATNRSLLVLDELGRGGSSSDGFAIAESVLHHVATHIQSLGFFATHYGGLGLGFKHHPKVKPLKMSIMVDEQSREITFLYKLVEGQSEGSFGMHVASMCGIAKEIVDRAQLAADNQEHTSLLIKERQQANGGMSEQEIIPLGLQSDFVRLRYGSGLNAGKLGCGEGATLYDSNIKANALKSIFAMIDGLD
ncbi:LAQU0S06e00914g1_1 [Lachancea quebecensis]|uniref:DNA mismatch repair protein n=1 Tax=Lachancea quebecensis TaxID=1654605 RepID=A0A0P1KS73_9SACH|nr:LAQU0S06e00914g1_1 [Lachancea quebecensis]